MGDGRYLNSSNMFKKIFKGGRYDSVKPLFYRLIPAFIFLTISLIVYGRVLFYSGYVSWGNLTIPLNENFYNVFRSVTWNPYYGNGTPVLTPWLSLIQNSILFLPYLLGGFISLNLGAKLFVVLSLFFDGYSFYLLSGRLSKRFLSRIIATWFFMLNPLMLQMVGSGDSEAFIVFGVYLLSLLLIAKSIVSKDEMRVIYWFFSILLLSFTVAFSQLFYIGVPFYLLFTFYLLVIEQKGSFAIKIIRFAKYFTSIICTLPALLMPFLLALFSSSYSFLPNSSLAIPLNTYISYSSNPLNLLLMNSINFNPIIQLLGPLQNTLIADTWSYAIISFVVFILGVGIVFRDRRILFFFVIAVLGSLLGSGDHSPISSLNVYLYVHMIGYQVLNASYYWEWIVIIPTYSIVLCLSLEKIIDYSIVRRRSIHLFEQKGRSLTRLSKIAQSKSLVLLIIVMIIVGFITFLPVDSQGYYGNEVYQIHPDTAPKELYSELPGQLSKFLGSSNLGVAYFIPEAWVFYGNDTGGSWQPILSAPNFRSPAAISYGSPPLESSDYSYWVYYEFYSNDTNNIAQLMSIMGIKYFVTFNNIEPAYGYLPEEFNKNSTKLMLNQKNVKLLYSSREYSIFESTLNVEMVSSDSSFTIFSSNYSALLDSASIGINISRLGLVFLGDLNSSNFNFILNNTSGMVFLNSQQGLETLAIDKFLNNTDSISLQKYANSYYLSPSQGWMSSNQVVPIRNFSLINEALISQSYPYILTSGSNKSFVINLNTVPRGNYTLWAYVQKSSVPDSKLEISNGNFSTIIDTYTLNNTLSNFFWARIPIFINSSGTKLTVTSLSGENGIEKLVILKRGIIEPEMNYLNRFIEDRSVNVINLSKIFNQNTKFASLNGTVNTTIGHINSVNKVGSSFILINNPNGYDMFGDFKNINIVHYAYFSEMTEKIRGFHIIPILGGLNFVLISNGKSYEAVFISKSLTDLLIGLIVLIATAIMFVIFVFYKKFIKIHTRRKF